MHFAINLTTHKIMKIRMQNVKHLFFFNESIVLGLGHSLGGCQAPPLDFVTDNYLPQSSRPPEKVQAINSKT
jgi:hypothetical protein